MKRPKNAFLLFCEKIRPTIVAATPGRPAHEYSKACGEKWKALSAEDRAMYRAKAAELAVAFRKECPIYHFTKNKKSKPVASMGPKLANLDPHQLLNRMFQDNPLLLQCMLCQPDGQGRFNVRDFLFQD
jgi:hypothetical protein